MEPTQKKDKKVINVNTRFIVPRASPKDNQSTSSSRGKRLFKVGDRIKSPKNELVNIFAKKNRAEPTNTGEDYGLDAQIKDRPLETSKNMLMIRHKTDRNEDMFGNSQHNDLKISLHKKGRRQSKKTNSLESLIKMEGSNTPKKQSFMKKSKCSRDSLSPEITMDSRNNVKTTKKDQAENEYYGLYMNCQQRIEVLKEEAETERKKYERVRKIYQEKMNQISQNKEYCQKNLGHIYCYESQYNDIVPEDVIVQNSIECSVDELLRTSRKNSDLANSSKISILSINSR